MKKRNEIVRTNAAHAQSQQKVNRLAAMAAILGVTAFSVAGMTTTFAVDNVAGTGEGTAFGTNSKAVQEGSIAVGNLAATNAKAGVAIGKSSLAGVSESVIPAADQEKHTANSVAIGRNAYASYTDTVVIGTNASSLRDHGGVTYQSGTGAIAIGRNAKSDYKESVAIGPEARTNFTQSVAVGYQAETTGQQGAATAVGPIAKAYEIGAAAIGNISRASGAFSTAVGTTSATYNPFATAVGNKATTRAASDTIVGTESGTGVRAGRAVAVGFGSHVAETSGVAVGDRARAFTAGGMAIGRAATSYGEQAIAIGNGGKADGKAGENAFATGQGAIALGTTARAMGTHGFAFGNDSVAGGNADLATTVSTALDTYNTAYSTYIKAQDAKLQAESDSKATQKRLASDARDFGISLYTLTNEEKQLLQTLGVDNAALQDEFFGKIQYNNNYDSAKPVVTAQLDALKKIAALDENAASTTTADVTRLIKRAQDLIAENTSDDTLKQKVTDTTAAATAEATKLDTAKETLKAAYASAKESALAIGTRAVAEGKTSIAIGTDANATNENSVAIGTQAKSTADHAVAIGVKAQATVANGVGLGSYSVADTEARKGYDLNENRMNTYAGLRGNALTASTAAVAVGTPRMTRQINYVAAGTDDTDAVNVAQLRSVNLKIAGDTVDQAAPTTNGTSKADVLLDSQTLKVVSANKAVLTTDATNNTITITPVTAELEKDPATGEVKPKDEAKGNALTTAQNVADMINNASPKIGDGLTNSDGKIVVNPADKSISVTANGVSVNPADKSLETTDKGLKVKTDNKTVEVGNEGLKVKADGTTITVGDKGLQVNTGNITNVTEGDKAGTVSVPEADKSKIATVDTVVNAINNAAWKATSDKDGSGEVEGTTEEKIKAGDKVTLKAGNNLKLKQAGKEFTYSLNPVLKELTSASFTNTAGDTTVINAEGMTITPKAADKKPVSLTKDGLDNGGNKIKNVAEGTDGTDGVNVNQLTGVKNDVNNLKDELKKHINSSGFSITSDVEGSGDKAEDNTTSIEKVKDGNKITLKAGDNLKIKQKGTNFTYSLNPELTGITSIAGKGTAPTVITLTESGDVTIGKKGEEKPVTITADKHITNVASNLPETKNKDDKGEATKSQAAPTMGTGENEVNPNNAATVGDVLNAGWNLQGNGTAVDLVKPYDAVNFVNGAGTTATVESADGKTSTVKYSVNIGDGLKVGKDNKITVQADGDTITVSKDGIKVNPELKGMKSIAGEGDGAGKVSFGPNGVVTVGGDNPVAIDGKKGKVTAGNVVLSKDGLNNGGNTITNVKAGEKDTDAVNVKQLKDELGKFTVKTSDGLEKDAGGNIKVKPADKSIEVTAAGVKVKPADKSLETTDDGLKVKTDNKTVEVGNEGLKVKADGTTITVGGKGLQVNTGSITNVTEGDKAGTVSVPKADQGKIATVGDVANAINNAAWQAKGGKTENGVFIGKDAAQPVKAGDVVTFNAGNNLTLTQKGANFTYALNPELKDITSIAGKGDNAGKVTFGDNGVVTVGTSGDANAISLNGKDGKISMGKVSLSKEGLNNGGNKITNVAAGTDPTDAVNVSQLRDVAGNMQAITNQLQGQVNRVGSQAAALSALKPIQYDPLEPTQIMAGVGHYQGQNSLALGVAHYKNESMMFHAGAAIGGNRSQVMANAGITWKVGSKADEIAVADVYRYGPISSAYVLQDKMGALEAQNLEQKGEINALREENKSQRAELDAVKAQLATVLSRLQG